MGLILVSLIILMILNLHQKDLNISDEDITIAFVGRLSFHAKAHHYPMYLALENISKATGKKLI